MGKGVGEAACPDVAAAPRQDAETLGPVFELELFSPGSLTETENEMTVVTLMARFLPHARIWARGLT